MKLRELQSVYLLAGIVLVLSGCLRFYGLGWGTHPDTGEFHRFHPDEATLVESAALVGVDLRQVTAPYGKAPMYILAGAARAVGYLVGIEPFVWQDKQSVRFSHMVGRGISALLGTMTVLAVFGIGCRLDGIWTGLLGAFCLGFSPVHIQQSHYYTVDVSFTFWATLAVYLMLRMPSQRTWLYVLCGLAWGMAGGTRLLGVILGIPFLIAVLWPAVGDDQPAKWWHRLRRLIVPRVLACGFIAVAVTLIGEPYLVLDPDHFFGRDDLRRFTMAMDVASGKLIRIWSLYDFSTTPYLFFLTHLLPYAVGTPLEIAALIGLGLVLWRRQRGWWVVLSWLGIYFALVGRLHTKPIRYTVPMLPVLALLGAWACVQAAFWLRTRTARRWVWILPMALVALASSARGIAMMRIYTTEDSRFQAARWVRANIPEGQGVLTERGGFPTYWMVPEDRYNRQIGQASYFIATEGNYPYSEKVRFIRSKLHGLNWIVLTDENRMRQYIEVPDRYPVAQRFYSQLASGDLGFERVASLKVGPGILGLEFPDEDAEPTITAFDHPRVSVYRRTGTDFDNLMTRWEAEVQADPALPDHHILAGVKAYHKKDWNGAIERFRRAVALRPSLTLGRLLLRETYLRQGRKAEADGQLQHLHRGEGIPMRAIVGLIKVGLNAEGVVYLEKYINWVKSRGRDDPQLREFTSLASRARFDLGLEYEGQKQYEKAVQEYLKVAQLHPEHSPTYTKLGNLYTALEQYDNAAAALGEAARRDSSRAEVWCSLAGAQRLGGHLDQANASIAKAIALDPSSSACRVEQLNVGSAYQVGGHLDKALAIYRGVLAHNPDFREAHVNLGVLHHTRKQYTQAIPAFRRAIQLSPDRAEYHLGLAQSLDGADRRQEAIEAYRHALSLHPDSPLARDRLESLVREKAAP